MPEVSRIATEIGPGDKRSRSATFACLAKDFELDDTVLELLVASPMDNLEDFRLYFSEEQEVAAFVNEKTMLEDQQLYIQVSRLTRAWTSLERVAQWDEAKTSMKNLPLHTRHWKPKSAKETSAKGAEGLQRLSKTDGPIPKADRKEVQTALIRSAPAQHRRARPKGVKDNPTRVPYDSPL